MGWKIRESNPYNGQKLFPSPNVLITSKPYSSFNGNGTMNYFLGLKTAGGLKQITFLYLVLNI